MSKRNAGIAGGKELCTWYREYNRKYFDGKCPTENVQVRFASGLHRGLSPMLGHFTTNRGGGVAILIDARLSAMPSVAKMTLIHEMVHAFLDRWREVGRGRDSPHGRRFNAKMRELAEAGAFDRLW